MGLQVAAAGKIINEFTGLAFAGGEFETDNPAIRFVSAEAWTRDAQGAHITFATAPVGTSSPVEGMRLTSEGILLVGTDTASGSAKLQVSGAISVSGITYAGTLALSATGANPITFSSGGTEGFRLAPTTRNLLVGTTTDDGSSKLRVNGTISAGAVNATGEIATSANSITVGAASASSGQGGNIRFRDDTGTTRWLAGHSGAAGATSFIIYDFANGKIPFLIEANAPTNAFIVKENGNLLVNTSTDDGSSKLQVAGTSTNYGFTAYNSTAVTGVTSTVVRAGAGQGTNALFNIVANDGTTSVFKALETKIGFFGATPVVKQTVTADAASILAALQAYGLAV